MVNWFWRKKHEPTRHEFALRVQLAPTNATSLVKPGGVLHFVDGLPTAFITPEGAKIDISRAASLTLTIPFTFALADKA